MKGLQNRVLGIFLGIFFSIVIAPALAHDPSHPELNGWFNKLASGKGLCCSFADGYVVADADWETRDGHYKVRIPKVVGSADMEWVDVPDDALITEPNRAGLVNREIDLATPDRTLQQTANVRNDGGVDPSGTRSRYPHWKIVGFSSVQVGDEWCASRVINDRTRRTTAIAVGSFLLFQYVPNRAIAGFGRPTIAHSPIATAKTKSSCFPTRASYE
jgi:hypothetical protein